MPNQAALPRTLSPRLIQREAAAAYTCLSPTKFSELVKKGIMPRPKVVGTRKLWDVNQLDSAIDDLPSEGESIENPWDQELSRLNK